jgi:hypothetical protein
MHARAALPHACSWLHVRVGFLARFRARGIFLRESLSKVAAAAALQLLLWYKKPPYKYTREGSYFRKYHIFIFPAPRECALKIRQINSAILKVPDPAWIR